MTTKTETTKHTDITEMLSRVATAQIARLASRLRGSDNKLEIVADVRSSGVNAYLDLRAGKEKATLVVPLPRQNDYGNWVLGDQFDRALCPLMVVLNGQPQHTSYQEMVELMLSGNVQELFPLQGKKNFLDRILWSFTQGRGRLTMTLCQRFLNLNLFNALPISGTPMQDWAMNHRLMIFDPIFPTLRPEEKLRYQQRKNELLYPWSSIGISDGAAAEKNYILQTELREYTAFGVRHHNPIRNLYSTLGMKGPEKPWVVSASAAKLEKRGISRGGWNWMTVFLDLPDNFEDQILVDGRHAGKEVAYKRSFQIFGEETVEVGDTILKGRILGINEDESPVVFDTDCDHAKVMSIRDGSVPFDGQDQPIRIVSLEVTYTFREGIKVTNQHGNKGIVRLVENLGSVCDGDGHSINIDVIVSAKSVQKRKNFGQILEALTTMTTPWSYNLEKGHVLNQVIVRDSLEVTQEAVEATLRKGAHKVGADGCLDIETPWGNFRTICGYVHWGVTKTPEEQLWQGNVTKDTNQKGLRTRGNKVSTIEIASLIALLGPGSKVVKEILSHQQGVDDVLEAATLLEGMRGNYRDNVPLVSPESFVYIPAGQGTFHSEEGLVGTVADEMMYPHGCYIQLPFALQVRVPFDRWKNEITEGIATMEALLEPDTRVFETDRLYVPPFKMRQPWRHPTGKYGLSDIASSLNQILETIDRLACGEIKEEQLSAVIFRFFHAVGKSLSLKSGKISQYLLSVRYPHSTKATATLGHDLEPNWIEIHGDMAHDLKVKDGDYVLVERFPCLGFMSTRIQRVQVTNDPQCKYVIRVSGNSLVSMNLDFDGDVIYIMSFHTDGAKRELVENFHHPHPRIKEVLDEMNSRKVPFTGTVDIRSLGLKSFPKMTPEEHASLNATSMAVKIWTGPTIALCYNLMRIVEGNIPYADREAHINIQVFLDLVGNSVFSQKHGTKSLREECIEAVCLADSDAMMSLGFPERESRQLCRIIQRKAEEMGVRGRDGLAAHYARHLEEGRSNIINAIVRRCHRSYFATRANLHPIDLLEHLEISPTDLVGHLIHPHLGTQKACQKREFNA